MRKFKVHTVQNRKNECGVACIHMLLKFYHCNVNYKSLCMYLKPSKKGLSIRQIHDFLSLLNVKTTFYKPPENSLKYYQKNFEKSNFPCMAMIKTLYGLHYIVIYKIDKTGIMYSDPGEQLYVKSNNIDILRKVLYIINVDFSSFTKIPDCIPIRKQTKNFVLKEIFVHKLDFLKLSIISIALSILGVISTIRTGIIIDGLDLMKEYYYILILFFLCIIFLIGLILENIISYIRGCMSVNIVHRIESNITNVLIDRFLNQEYQDFDNSKVGDITSRITNGINMSTTLISSLFNFLPDFLIVLFSMVWMFYTNGILAFVVFVSLCINLVIVSSATYNLHKKNYEMMYAASNFNAMLVEIVQKFLNIKITRAEKFHKKNLEKTLSTYIKKKISIEKFMNLVGSYQIFSISLCNLFILSFGSWYTSHNHISIGQLTTFVMITSILQSKVSGFVNLFFEFEGFNIGYERINQIIDLDNQDIESKKCVSEIPKITNIQFKDYNIHYDTCLLKHTDICFRKSNIIIKGNSGTGKSSLVKTLSLLSNNYGGTIYLNDTDINNINKEIIKSKIVYLSNSTPMITGKIIDVLCLGKTILNKYLEEVCLDFCILDFIKQLANGFNEEIYADGSNLSTGQRQRLALVQAMLLEPDVLILDEALSNIDEENKVAIINNLQKYQCMKIFITHDSLNLAEAQTFIFHNKSILEIK